MGQQQLLLVILVTILVGIATVVAMNVFGGAADDANRDAVRQDMLQGATSAQAIHARPTMLDGAGGDFTTLVSDDGSGGQLTDELLQRLGMPIVLGTADNDVPTGEWGNANGTYSIASDVTANSFTLIGSPASGTPTIQALIEQDQNTGNWDITWTPGS